MITTPLKTVNPGNPNRRPTTPRHRATRTVSRGNGKDAASVDANNAAARAKIEAEGKLRCPGGEYKNGGGPKPNMRNAQAALTRLGCVCSFNRFKHRFVVNGPREKKLSASRTVNLDIGEIRDDHDFSELRDYIIAAYDYDPLFNHVKEAVEILGLQRKFHPILDYFAGLPPRDEVKRLDTWMITVFGAEDSPYTRAVGRLSLIAAVCRVRFPGCKFDTAPVLIGLQGVAKSTALRVLAVKDEWFTDQPILAQRSQTQMELMEGGWIYEIADLDGMRRAETTYIKAFMSRQFDKSRMAYRHLTEERGRQCVFFATTNDAKFLKDETGNRRWWPIATQGMANVAWLRENRDQIWAEANEAALALIRENGMLPYGALELPPELWEVAAIEQKKRTIPHPWLEKLQDLLMPDEGQGARYHSTEIFASALMLNPAKEYDAYGRLKSCMVELGFQHSTELRINKVKRNGYYLPADENDDHPSAEPRPGTKLIKDIYGPPPIAQPNGGNAGGGTNSGEHTRSGSNSGNGSSDDDVPF